MNMTNFKFQILTTITKTFQKYLSILKIIFWRIKNFIMILPNFKKISHQFTYQFGQLVPHNHLHWGHEILLEDNSIRNSNTFQILGLFALTPLRSTLAAGRSSSCRELWYMTTSKARCGRPTRPAPRSSIAPRWPRCGGIRILVFSWSTRSM